MRKSKDFYVLGSQNMSWTKTIITVKIKKWVFWKWKNKKVKILMWWGKPGRPSLPKGRALTAGSLHGRQRLSLRRRWSLRRLPHGGKRVAPPSEAALSAQIRSSSVKLHVRVCACFYWWGSFSIFLKCPQLQLKKEGLLVF